MAKRLNPVHPGEYLKELLDIGNMTGQQAGSSPQVPPRSAVLRLGCAHSLARRCSLQAQGPAFLPMTRLCRRSVVTNPSSRNNCSISR